KGKGFTTTSLYKRFLEICDNQCVIISERTFIKRILDHFQQNVEIIKPDRVNEPRIIMPKISKNAALYSYISDQNVNSDNSPFSIDISDYAILHRIAQKIRKDID